MKFEWDAEKNLANIHKHYLDFADAHEIFDAPMLVQADSRENYQEIRLTGIGFLHNFAVVVVFVEIQNDIIRIISLRKALKYERKRFEEELRDRLGTAANDV